MNRFTRLIVAVVLAFGTATTPALAMMHGMPMAPMPSTGTTMAPMPSTGTTMAPMPSTGTTMAPMPSTPTTMMPMMMDGMLVMADGSMMPMMMEDMMMTMPMGGVMMIMMPMDAMVMMDDDMMPMSSVPATATMMMDDGMMMPMSDMMMDGMMMMPMDGMMMMPDDSMMMPMPMPTDPSMPTTTPMAPGMPMPGDDMPMPMPTDPAMPMPMPMPTDPAMPMPTDPAMPMPTDPAMPSTMPMDPGMPMPSDPMAVVTREAANDRIAAAVQISKSQFETGTVEAAVLVNGYSYAEAIVAPALAGALDAPVLLSRADGVSAATLDELDRLGVERVYLVGGTRSLSDALKNDLIDAGFAVSRIAGANKYATAAAVARKVSSLRGGIDRAIVINGDSSYTAYAAITAAPYSYSQGFPFLFTSSTGVPSATLSAIRTYRIDNVTVLGGTSSVSKTAYATLTRTTSGRADNRIAGANRFEAARNLAQHAITRGWAEPAHVGLVNGTKGFGEALAGAAVTGSQNGVVLLVTQTELPRASELFLAQYNDVAEVDMVHLYGSISLISDGVMNDVMGMGMGMGDDDGSTGDDDHTN